MTTTQTDATRFRAGDALPEEQRRARNTSPVSENKIHEDDIARTYGFRGGLVPGWTTYAYLASYLSRTLGPAWVTGGSATVSLNRPVYDGDTIRIGGLVREANGDAARGALTVDCWVDGPDATRCAPGSAALAWGDVGPVDARPPFAATDQVPRLPEERGPISRATAPVGETLPPVLWPADAEAVTRFLAGIDEQNPLFREGASDRLPLMHPGAWPSIANRVLSSNFQLGPWIHTRSEIRHLAPARVGGMYTAYGVLTEAFEKRGHQYVTADVLITDGDDQPVVRVLHTAIVVVAKRES